MQVRHIFVGIDLGDKNSVARMAVDREKTERFGFVNNRQVRRLSIRLCLKASQCSRSKRVSKMALS